MAQNSAGQRVYLLSDGLGSIRQVISGTTIVSQRDFDPYGNPTGATAFSDPYGFSGEWWEKDVKLLHLRARWYLPESATFLSKDPWPGDDRRPQSLNGWNYVEGNPVNRMDPSGKHPICIAALATGGTIVVLDGACIVALAALGGTAAVLWYMQQDINLPGGGPTRPDYAPDQPAPAPAPAPPQVYPDTYTGTGENPFSLLPIYQSPRPQQTPIPFPIPYNPRLPLPTETCTETPGPKWYLYHYTDDAGLAGILASQQIRPSTKNPANPNADAQWGDGQYFTDISPQDASIGSAYQLSRALFTTPWKQNFVKNWIKINIAGLPVSRVAPVFSRTYGDKSIYLHPSQNALNVVGRIDGSGPTPFTR